jgi:hypothetical protein
VGGRMMPTVHTMFNDYWVETSFYEGNGNRTLNLLMVDIISNYIFSAISTSFL